MKRSRDDRPRLAMIGVLATLGGAAVWAIGASVLHSLMIAAAVATLGFVLPSDPVEPDQRPAVPTAPRRGGTRRELMRLSWSYGRGTKGAGLAAVDRLAAIAARRLRLLGLDTDDLLHAPAVERAIGGLAYRVLIARELEPPIRHRTIAACLEAIERLDVPTGPPSTERTRGSA